MITEMHEVITEPEEGWCNELFSFNIKNPESIAPIIRTYYCRLPKGHQVESHWCPASERGK